MGRILQKGIAFLAFMTWTASSLFAQCSDGGVCKIGAAHSDRRHVIGLSYTYGHTSQMGRLDHHTVQGEGTFSLGSTSQIIAYVPWSSQSGALGSISALGDVILVWDQTVWREHNSVLDIQFGAKLSTGKVNEGGLPQAYQSSLGTNDLLFGISYSTEPWVVAAGYQLSRGRSDNAVDRLKRGDDLLLRVGYTVAIGLATSSLELLGIQRLEKSTALRKDITGAERLVEIAETDRPQLNVLGKIAVPVSDSYELGFFIALPFLNRPSNIDGLKRGLTLSAGVKYRL